MSKRGVKAEHLTEEKIREMAERCQSIVLGLGARDEPVQNPLVGGSESGWDDENRLVTSNNFAEYASELEASMKERKSLPDAKDYSRSGELRVSRTKSLDVNTGRPNRKRVDVRQEIRREEYGEGIIEEEIVFLDQRGRASALSPPKPSDAHPQSHKTPVFLEDRGRAWALSPPKPSDAHPQSHNTPSQKEAAHEIRRRISKRLARAHTTPK